MNNKAKADFVEILKRIRLPSMGLVLREFMRVGIPVGHYCQSDVKYEAMLKAFQRRFRPSSITGTIDVETAAILYSMQNHFPERNSYIYK